MAWDFANNLNWDLILRQNYLATNITTDGNNFVPIPTITVSVNSQVLLIGAKSNNAKPGWYKAGYVASKMPFSPSSTGEFTIPIQTSRSIKFGLNRLTLLRFTDYGIIPFLLEINISKWHKDMLLEIWGYSGNLGDIESSLEEIKARLSGIESALDGQFVFPGSSSTQFNNVNSSSSVGII